MKYQRYCQSTICKEEHPNARFITKCWETIDKKYRILQEKSNRTIHLMINRIDNEPIHDFIDLMKIKNDLLGEDIIAIEVYPKESDFRNGSNTYHLWTWENIDVLNLNSIYNQ